MKKIKVLVAGKHKQSLHKQELELFAEYLSMDENSFHVINTNKKKEVEKFLKNKDNKLDIIWIRGHRLLPLLEFSRSHQPKARTIFTSYNTGVVNMIVEVKQADFAFALGETETFRQVLEELQKLFSKT